MSELDYAMVVFVIVIFVILAIVVAIVPLVVAAILMERQINVVDVSVFVHGLHLLIIIRMRRLCVIDG